MRKPCYTLMADPQKFTNWRFNPFTNVKNPASLTEQHTVKYFSESNLYGIQAMEGITLDNPSSVSLVYQSNGQRLEEVPKTQPPSRGQFRVEFGAVQKRLEDYVESLLTTASELRFTQRVR